jgi:hypothetical protein
VNELLKKLQALIQAEEKTTKRKHNGIKANLILSLQNQYGT